MIFRRIVKLALLGVLTTVAVAWVCALLIELPGDVYTPSLVRRVAFSRTHLDIDERFHDTLSPASLPISPDQPHKPSVYATVWSRFGGVYIASGTNIGYFPAPTNSKPMAEVVRSCMRRQALPWLTGDAPWPAKDVSLYHSARGWPFLALWCEFKTSPTLPWSGLPRGGIRLPWPRVKPAWYTPPPPVTTLPFFPLWTGLVGDTMVYAAAWWVVLGRVGRARERLRVHRGRCARCGYDRRGLGDVPCPECAHTPDRATLAQRVAA